MANEKKEMSLTEKMVKGFGLSTNVKTEKVGKVTASFYSFSDVKKGKDGKEVSTEIQIRDKATVATLYNIDAFIGMSTIAVKGLVCEISRISAKIAKETVNSDVVTMLSKIYPFYSKTTLQMYRRVGLVFVDRSVDGYQYRAGIPQSVSVNNLSVVLALATKKANLEELTEEELTDLYETFYADYIATGRVNLTATQSVLKKQVKDINDSENAIDGNTTPKKEDKKEEGKEVKVTPKTEKADNITAFKEYLAHYSEVFKGNGAILSAITDILKELATMEETEEPEETEETEEPEETEE